MYLVGCLGFHLEALQARFERAFEFPKEYELRFDLSTLLRAEIDVRFAAYTQALAAGWMTPNEVRAGEGLDPVDGGDEPHLQQQYIPLSQSGEAQANGVAVPNPPPEPAPTAPPPEPPPEAELDPALVRALLRHRIRRAA
jgi:crotonobetainyl-CoA:carnitine CoA-transferase CaiB-like acyl-CoA transferase